MKRLLAAVLGSALTIGGAFGAQAAFSPDVEKAYNTAVQGQDALDGLDVTVQETTVSSKTNIASSKKVNLQVSGIKNTSLSVDLQINADETDAEKFYRNGFYYETGTEGKIKRKMDREEIWNDINSQIYLDMTSNYLTLLYSVSGDNGHTIYHFAADQSSLGDYTKKLLDGYSEAGGAQVDFLQGTMEVDGDGHVLSRDIRAVYTVGEGEQKETFMKEAKADFSQDGEVTVSLPDLSGYEDVEKTPAPAATLTAQERTVYATADINVRAAGSLDGAIIGGFSRGSGMSQTGYTSDGWVQILYNGAAAYVWGEYVSQTKPVVTKQQTGTMYTTVDLNVRQSYTSESTLLGVIPRGSAVEITGSTDNGWTRVTYKGQTGYVFTKYLTASEPAAPTYTKDAQITGTVTDASYGSLTLSTPGGTMMFNTTYAQMNLTDTICTGDSVTVVYTGQGTPYTASKVTDGITHAQTETPQKSVFSCEGVITRVSGTSMEMTCSDGVYRTFDLSGASVESEEPLAPGLYVTASWMSANGGERNNIPAIAVS